MTGKTPTTDPRIDQYPLFISYPRTGSHWINAVMELYFDRPRLRERRTTFMDKSRTDWMWFHDHDHPRLDIARNADLYLYRDPVETVFSYLNYQHNEAMRKPFFGRREKKAFTDFDAAEIEAECHSYRANLEKWLAPGRSRAAVRHDRFKSDRHGEFRKITDVFGQPFDAARCDAAFSRVTQEALVEQMGDRIPLGKHMLSDDYRTGREHFRETWSARVREICCAGSLAAWFD